MSHKTFTTFPALNDTSPPVNFFLHDASGNRHITRVKEAFTTHPRVFAEFLACVSPKQADYSP